ncbi:MAG: vanadium-dependent haloperoxidase [Pseudomonadota bacterium]
MTKDRRQEAYRARVEAAEMAKNRHHPVHLANGDEQRFAAANYAMCFTKGLPHSATTGLINDRRDFEAFRKAIDEGSIGPFSMGVPVATACEARRYWEAPTAGTAFDLEGPDAQAVTMAPAPALGSDELAYEMAEVYELALIRDVPLTELRTSGSSTAVADSVNRLNALAYRPAEGPGRGRKTDAAGDVTAQTVFRGSSTGVEVGPYLSQFMLIGSVDQGGASAVADGRITFGAQQIDQRVPVASATDYMTDANSWLEVQRGCAIPGSATLVDPVPRRFILTPRDLATYVHFDALYQAYLKACLILLGMGTPFDPGFGALSGQGGLFALESNGTHRQFDRQAGGFALYGGPHILTLVTEVATRALKAVRYQKFNNHIRLRPEALAGRIEFAPAIEAQFPGVGAMFQDMEAAIQPVVTEVRSANGTAFLPMAFAEGSPMHPAYGAGHATVAGACVTILKAFFDTSTAFVRRPTGGDPVEAFSHRRPDDTPLAYVPDGTGAALVAETDGPFLTLEGELNKLAANISIGRNMVGVHYFSDYYDSLRMGEEIAIGLLEEQAICYPTDPFVLTVPTFDGGVRRIGAR